MHSSNNCICGGLPSNVSHCGIPSIAIVNVEDPQPPQEILYPDIWQVHSYGNIMQPQNLINGRGYWARETGHQHLTTGDSPFNDDFMVYGGSGLLILNTQELIDAGYTSYKTHVQNIDTTNPCCGPSGTICYDVTNDCTEHDLSINDPTIFKSYADLEDYADNNTPGIGTVYNEQTLNQCHPFGIAIRAWSATDTAQLSQPIKDSNWDKSTPISKFTQTHVDDIVATCQLYTGGASGNESNLCSMITDPTTGTEIKYNTTHGSSDFIRAVIGVDFTMAQPGWTYKFELAISSRQVGGLFLAYEIGGNTYVTTPSINPIDNVFTSLENTILFSMVVDTDEGPEMPAPTPTPRFGVRVSVMVTRDATAEDSAWFSKMFFFDNLAFHA